MYLIFSMAVGRGWLAKSVRAANLATTCWVIIMGDTAGEVVPLAGYFGYGA
jgi:hypothetical protein